MAGNSVASVLSSVKASSFWHQSTSINLIIFVEMLQATSLQSLQAAMMEYLRDRTQAAIFASSFLQFLDRPE